MEVSMDVPGSVIKCHHIRNIHTICRRHIPAAQAAKERKAKGIWTAAAAANLKAAAVGSRPARVATLTSEREAGDGAGFRAGIVPPPMCAADESPGSTIGAPSAGRPGPAQLPPDRKRQRTAGSTDAGSAMPCTVEAAGHDPRNGRHDGSPDRGRPTSSLLGEGHGRGITRGRFTDPPTGDGGGKGRQAKKRAFPGIGC